ncbi:MAG: hypothetical protein E5X10_23665, partial [Mesorhizobium sp.]
MFPAIDYLAGPDVEDDATEHIKLFAVAFPGIAMDADYTSVLTFHDMQKIRPEGAKGLPAITAEL